MSLILISTLAALAAAPAPARVIPAPAATDALRVALDDATIVAIYDGANTDDIETGKLGATKGSTQAVRDYGAMLVKAHTDARQQGRDLAKKLGVTPTPPAGRASAEAHAAAMKTLRAAAHGVGFDHAFLEHEIAYHKAVIAAVTGTLLPAIQNAELKALVDRVAPVFVQHEKAGETLLAGIGK